MVDDILVTIRETGRWKAIEEEYEQVMVAEGGVFATHDPGAFVCVVGCDITTRQLYPNFPLLSRLYLMPWCIPISERLIASFPKITAPLWTTPCMQQGFTQRVRPDHSF